MGNRNSSLNYQNLEKKEAPFQISVHPKTYKPTHDVDTLIICDCDYHCTITRPGIYYILPKDKYNIQTSCVYLQKSEGKISRARVFKSPHNLQTEKSEGLIIMSFDNKFFHEHYEDDCDIILETNQIDEGKIIEIFRGNIILL